MTAVVLIPAAAVAFALTQPHVGARFTGAPTAAAANRAAAPAPAPAGPIETAVQFGAEAGSEGMIADRIRAANATKVRLNVRWTNIAPAVRPAGFKASDPGEPAYNWGGLDQALRAITAEGLTPFLTVFDAPLWAEQGKGEAESHLGDLKPDVAALSAFATAIARRYAGGYAGLPRVRYWQVWNEPNVTVYLRPQFVGGRLAAPSRYRQMVNAFARSVHAVRADNKVIAGGMSPFTLRAGDIHTVAPLRFMRELLCMSSGPKPRRTCRTTIEFDIWAHHPYTSGDASHSAERPDDVSLGDMGEMKALLDAAVRAGQVRHRQPVDFWVTEFSWDSSPPDPRGVPVRIHARWVAEAVYRMWQVGVKVISWHQLRDTPFPEQNFQAGLYALGPGGKPESDRPKPALAAFRFPFVAYRDAREIRVWGLAPGRKRTTVVIERGSAGAWRRLATLRSNRYGIFSGTFEVPSTAAEFVRARVAGASPALPFSLRPVPDRRVNPFGT